MLYFYLNFVFVFGGMVYLVPKCLCAHGAASTSVFSVDSGSRCCQNRGKCQDVLRCRADFQDNGEMPQEEEAEWNCVGLIYPQTLLLCGLVSLLLFDAFKVCYWSRGSLISFGIVQA